VGGEVDDQQRQRRADQSRDERAAVGERAERDALVTRVGDVDPEEDVDALAALERGDDELFRRLVERDDDSHHRGRARPAERAWAHVSPGSG
jgi:hypothetical protein